MENNTYIKASICLSDIPKELIHTADNGKKYLNFQITERQNKGQYGETHSIALRYKASDGNWYTQYIGKGEVASFGSNGGGTPLPPPPAQAQQTTGAGAAAASAARVQNNAGPSPNPAPEPSVENPDEDIPF